MSLYLNENIYISPTPTWAAFVCLINKFCLDLTVLKKSFGETMYEVAETWIIKFC